MNKICGIAVVAAVISAIALTGCSSGSSHHSAAATEPSATHSKAAKPSPTPVQLSADGLACKRFDTALHSAIQSSGVQGAGIDAGLGNTMHRIKNSMTYPAADAVFSDLLDIAFQGDSTEFERNFTTDLAGLTTLCKSAGYTMQNRS